MKTKPKNSIIYVLHDKIGSIELLERMGSELDIVNDARISFNRETDFLNQKDIKLLKYLIEHKHTSPLRSNVFKFRIKAPIYIARQMYKHVIAASYVDEQRSWNEQSLRYTEITPEFYVPESFYKSDSKNRQCSSNELCESQDYIRELYKNTVNTTYDSYKQMLDKGVSKEVARGILPACTYTSFVLTISLQALMFFIDLRQASGAQNEIQSYANAFLSVLKQTHPNLHSILYKPKEERDNI